MKKVSIVVHKFYQNNRLFDLSDKIVNRDNCMHPFYILKNKFKELGYDLSTNDINSIEESVFVIYNEMPNVLPIKKYIDKSYLLIFESELIKPDNWNKDNHQYFHRIFTWKDVIVDNKKYIKINFSQEIIKNINKDVFKKKKLCTLIAGNKIKIHPLELYSKRVEAIDWFEKNHRDDFDFYGIGWDKYVTTNNYVHYFINKFKLASFFSKKYLAYKGKVENKRMTLEQYKFAICYENARDISGYITEKIFDCFFAGCIPIYWGANNIIEHIPKECFVDKREFKTYDELYNFMINMSEKTYLNYLNAIESFLNSEQAYLYSSEYFATTIINSLND